MWHLQSRVAPIALMTACALFSGASKRPAPKFLPADAIDITTFLPPPPAATTAEAREELALVLRVQREATEAEKARAKAEKKLKLDAFTPIIGPWFTTENAPKTAALLKQLESDSKFFTAQGKEHFRRIRPCDAGAGVTDITNEDEKEFSYPSGHATRGTLFAAVLAEIFPDLRDQLIARGQEIGYDRIVAGMHYPSDIIAGRVLGQALARLVLADPRFKIELELVRSELVAAKAKAAAGTPPVQVDAKERP